MWMNLHTLPTGKSMYTVAVTLDPVDCDPQYASYDEVDVVASSRATVAEVIEAARAECVDMYGPDHRIVGVSNQSDGYVMQENWEGIS